MNEFSSLRLTPLVALAARVRSLTYKSLGTLSWRGLKIGGTQDGPSTDVPAWLAPRRVSGAASVRTAAGEAERYLFYRGVGRMDAPLSIVRTADGTQLQVHS